jgi:hypothetical protein
MWINNSQKESGYLEGRQGVNAPAFAPYSF